MSHAAWEDWTQIMGLWWVSDGSLIVFPSFWQYHAVPRSAAVCTLLFNLKMFGAQNGSPFSPKKSLKRMNSQFNISTPLSVDLFIFHCYPLSWLPQERCSAWTMFLPGSKHRLDMKGAAQQERHTVKFEASFSECCILSWSWPPSVKMSWRKNGLSKRTFTQWALLWTSGFLGCFWSVDATTRASSPWLVTHWASSIADHVGGAGTSSRLAQSNTWTTTLKAGNQFPHAWKCKPCKSDGSPVRWKAGPKWMRGIMPQLVTPFYLSVILAQDPKWRQQEEDDRPTWQETMKRMQNSHWCIFFDWSSLSLMTVLDSQSRILDLRSLLILVRHSANWYAVDFLCCRTCQWVNYRFNQHAKRIIVSLYESDLMMGFRSYDVDEDTHVIHPISKHTLETSIIIQWNP